VVYRAGFFASLPVFVGTAKVSDGAEKVSGDVEITFRVTKKVSGELPPAFARWKLPSR
jgi:hypothetical protein